MQKTFVMIKPDGVRKGLTEEIIKRFEKEGLKVEQKEQKQLSDEEAEELYSIHEGKPFFKPLIDFVTSGQVVTMVISGENVIERVREIMGATNPQEAAPGTIRADYAKEIEENIIHGSDSEESARREIAIFFKDS